MSFVEALNLLSFILEAALVGVVFGIIGRVFALRARTPSLGLSIAIGFLGSLAGAGVARLVWDGSRFAWTTLSVDVVLATAGLTVAVRLLNRGTSAAA